MVHHLHGEVGVAAAVAGRKALVHRLSVDEELEGRAGLSLGGHLVVFPRFEVDVAHPGFHMSGLCLKGHETTVHEADHITDGVHRRHVFLNLTAIVVEDLDRMREVEIIVDGILIAIVFLREVFVDGLSLCDVLNEVFDFLMALVLPGVGRAPVLVEVVLHLSHLLAGGLLGVFLHAGVDGGVNLQTFGIEGVAVVEVILAPVLQIVGQCLAEVVGIAVVGRLHAVVEFDVELLE